MINSLKKIKKGMFMGYIRNIIRSLKNRLFSNSLRAIEVNSLLLGKINTRQIVNIKKLNSLKEAEFRVFSQWGDDGIIQYLINKIPIINHTFVEFGVEDYTESNTRYLLMNDNWKGLVIDGSYSNICNIKSSYYYWMYDLTAVCSFIDTDNINNTLLDNGFKGDIGILSIDIDGNDYWVWKAISVISPCIVICEFNSVFGDQHSITVPYNPSFQRTEEHCSNLYFGASLTALKELASEKGYSFIGANSSSVNAYFIKSDLLQYLDIDHFDIDYYSSKCRESRDRDGNLTFLSGASRIKEISKKSVINLSNNELVLLKNIM